MRCVCVEEERHNVVGIHIEDVRWECKSDYLEIIYG